MRDPARMQRLRSFARLVTEWSSRLDLVAPGDVDRLWERHVQDSLRLVGLVAELPAGRCIDVGSGAGFPGVPLAIASPDRAWILLEPRRKRGGFLELAARELGLGNVSVVLKSAEEAASDPALRRAHVLATARALAPPQRSIELLLPLVREGGTAAVFVGDRARLPSKALEWASGIVTVAVSNPREA